MVSPNLLTFSAGSRGRDRVGFSVPIVLLGSVEALLRSDLRDGYFETAGTDLWSDIRNLSRAWSNQHRFNPENYIGRSNAITA